MKVFLTPPMNYLSLTERGDGLYVIGQFYKKNEEYRNYIRKAKKENRFIILDNGVGEEGEILSNKELFDITLEIEPNEVIPLDVLYNDIETIANMNEFVGWLKEARKKEKLLNTTLLAVPQGKTFSEWLYCYKLMCKNRYVSCIGMSKKAIPYIMKEEDIMKARLSLVKKLITTGILSKTKDHHFLGQGNPLEFTHYSNIPNFRSTDSCYPILAGMNDIDISDKDNFKRIPTPADYFELEIPESKMNLIDKNIETLKQCCNFKK